MTRVAMAHCKKKGRPWLHAHRHEGPRRHQHRGVGGVQDHQVFLQDQLRHGKNQAGGVLLCRPSQNLFLLLRALEGNHAQPQLQAGEWGNWADGEWTAGERVGCQKTNWFFCFFCCNTGRSVRYTIWQYQILRDVRGFSWILGKSLKLLEDSRESVRGRPSASDYAEAVPAGRVSTLLNVYGTNPFYVT